LTIKRFNALWPGRPFEEQCRFSTRQCPAIHVFDRISGFQDVDAGFMPGMTIQSNLIRFNPRI
jgi:hypothetical protein